MAWAVDLSLKQFGSATDGKSVQKLDYVIQFLSYNVFDVTYVTPIATKSTGKFLF